jgi:hypothetical protein
MPRDGTREERDLPDRHEDRRYETPPRDDFGQADFSSSYAYDPDRRAGFRVAEESAQGADDYGQADYSPDFVFDPDRGRAYRRCAGEAGPVDPEDPERIYGRRMAIGEYRRGERPSFDGGRGLGEPSRSWAERAGAFFTGREGPEPRRRRGPSDRVLWTVIVERLENERGLDLHDVEVLVDDSEVTLNGTVRRKEERRRIEDVADLEGVRHVQNNLRVRERRWF